MSTKKKIFIFFFVFTLVSFGLFSSVNVHADGELGKLANGEGKWGKFWKPIEMYRWWIRSIILNRTTRLKVLLKEQIALLAIK